VVGGIWGWGQNLDAAESPKRCEELRGGGGEPSRGRGRKRTIKRRPRRKQSRKGTRTDLEAKWVRLRQKTKEGSGSNIEKKRSSRKGSETGKNKVWKGVEEMSQIKEKIGWLGHDERTGGGTQESAAVVGVWYAPKQMRNLQKTSEDWTNAVLIDGDA